MYSSRRYVRAGMAALADFLAVVSGMRPLIGQSCHSPSMRRTAGMRCQKDAQHCLRKSQRFGSSPRHPGKSSTVRDREKRLVLNLTGEGLRKVPLLKPMTGHGCGLCD